LGRWATFLARGADGVPAEKTNEEMWFPQVMYFPSEWVLGWGLGLMLFNHQGTIYGGHAGAMAGHLAAVYIDRKTRTGAAALTNASTGVDTDLLAVSLAAKTNELLPEPIEPLRPEEPAPDAARAVLRRWGAPRS